MSWMTDLLSTVFERRYRGAETLDTRPIADLCADLMSSRGEVSGGRWRARSSAVTRRWTRASGVPSSPISAPGWEFDTAALRVALDGFVERADLAAYRALMELAEPPRQELIRRLNQVPGATGQLVRMRADLLRFAGEDPALARLDHDFRHLFASWFNRGFLVLRPIDWKTPANILEKVIDYEAVHAIDGWEPLRHRLAPEDRRCFAFFHPAMPDEPLIFVEVALTRGIPGSIQALLTPERAVLAAEAADTAVFYSISNCQAGLAGISFGNSLIKQVVEDLSRDLPGLTRFATLSPIPGLAGWLAEQGLAEAAAQGPEALAPLAARYLLDAKDSRGRPQDPVARFHLGNGAIVEVLHPEGDLSDKGRARSGGAMVTYLYDRARIDENHEAFAAAHRIAASRRVQALAREVRGPARTRKEKDDQPSA